MSRISEAGLHCRREGVLQIPQPGRRKKARAAAASQVGEDASATLTDRAYTELEELIVTLQLPPGSAASEGMLSKRLRIGRTPIREALQRLARERLVVILPRRGIVVSEINLKSHLRLLETRREVERLVTRLAARRATEEERVRFRDLAEKTDETGFMRADRAFNELILVASKNEFAAGSMRLMQSLSRRFWFHHYKEAADMPETAKLHADQARAIAAADEAGAARATDRLIALNEAFARATVSSDL